jgi:hypothetical protein
MTDALAKAREARQTLAAATEELNDSIAKAEQELLALKLGVTASVLLEQGEDWESYLRFGKHGDKWRLVYESGPVMGEPEDWRDEPLLNASKEVRLRAVDKFEELLIALVDKATEQAEDVRTKATRATSFAETVAKTRAAEKADKKP